MKIPGDAPALAEVHITHSGGAAAPIWALIAWWEKSQLENRVWNGDFDLPDGALGTRGWSVAVVANINGAATSITRITTASKYAPGSGEIVCPATADTGANFRIFRRFKRGVTYRAEVWIQSAAQTTATYIRLGNGAANDKASSSNTNLSTTFQRIFVDWTPTADRDDAHVAVNIAAATATTFRIDGVMVYEGTTAPTSANQSFGRGGYPPVGIIEAECSSASSFIADASANYRGGFGEFITGSVDTSLNVPLIVDPALLVSDDHHQDEIAIEVWARVELDAAKAATIVLSAFPITNFGGVGVRYSLEYGSAGRALTMPSSGVRFRFVKAGTIMLPTNLGRYWLEVLLSLNAASGTAGIDYLLLVPPAHRILGPTGKANDSNYPKFISVVGTEVTRKIMPDGSGRYSEPAVSSAEIAAPGLGGSLIELPSNGVDVDWLVKLSNLVPDDPTVNTATEQLSHSATVHLAVTPRVHLARSS